MVVTLGIRIYFRNFAEKVTVHKRFHEVRRTIQYIVLSISLCSCYPTKELQKGQTILSKNHIKVLDPKPEMGAAELRSQLAQKANISLFGIQYGILLKKIFNNMGEDPQVFDPKLVQISKDNIENYLKSRGYFQANVQDSVRHNENKTEVSYTVQLNQRTNIQQISYDIRIPAIDSLIKQDSASSFLRIGDSYNEELLTAERARIKRLLRDNGYYNFKNAELKFIADTTDKKVNLAFQIKSDSIHKASIQSVKVYINPNDQLDVNYLENFQDSVVKPDGTSYYFKKHLPLNINLIDYYNQIRPRELYNFTKVNNTHASLSNLGAVGKVGLKSNEYEANKLAYELLVIPRKSQSYSWNVEGTNVSGNIGFAAGLGYTHYNTYKHSNRLKISINSSLEFVNNQKNSIAQSITYGGMASYEIPILYPLNFIGRQGAFIPKTNIDLAVNSNTRPEYDRFRSSMSFGYKWRRTASSVHSLQLLTLNHITISAIDSLFLSNVRKLNLENSYQNTLITSSSYSYNYNSKKNLNDSDYRSFSFKIESSGALLNLLKNQVATKGEGDSYEILNIPFAQYFKTDLELRKYVDFGDHHTIAMRLGVGVGIPYGNLKSLPIDKQYQSGGFNDIRAWQNRSLGPGGFALENTENILFYNQLSDMKLIGNIEYRFPLYGNFHGAFFFDAGNIWALSPEDEREEASFDLNKFYKQIAIGTGIGLRYDFEILQLVLDYGTKVYDPRSSLNNNWVFSFSEIPSLSVFNFGLNYPF